MKTARPLVLAAVAAAAAAAAACGDGPRPRIDADLVAETRIAHAEIDENSGLTRWRDAWWTHEDSGAGPVVWRSATLDFADAEAVRVPGAANADWEDMAVLDDGSLLVADVGDNLRLRKNVRFYRVAADCAVVGEPGARAFASADEIPVAWPDGPHDCEAVAVIDGHVHAVTKDRGEGTILFRFDALVPGRPNVPKEIARLDLGDREQATSAVFDGASRSLVVLTYTQLARYPLDRLTGAPADATWIGARQAEAVALDGDDLVFTNEQRDVFRVPAFRDWRFARLAPARAAASLGPDVAALPLADAKTGESLSWRLDDGALHVQATLVCAGEPRPARPDENRLGSGFVLAVGSGDARHVGAGETLLAVTLSADGAAVHRVALAEKGLVLAPVRDASASAVRDGSTITLTAAIPDTEAFGGAAPARFACHVQGVGLGREASPPRFGGPDGYALYRPFLWAWVTTP